MPSESDFQPDIESLLQPLPGDLPAGPSLRYDPVYLAIRTAREEEDPALPLREWSRPLKKADWRAVDQHASGALRERSKDFQIAAWLCEAWTQSHKLPGFVAALQVLEGLVQRFWDTAHPQIEEGDDEARIAPFMWLNENLPRVLLLHVPLMHLPERHPSAIYLQDWDRALALDLRKPVAKKGAAPEVNAHASRAEIVVGAQGSNLDSLLRVRAQVREALQAWQGLVAAVDQHMGMQAPSFAKVPDMLQRMERACDTLIDGRGPAAVAEHEPEPDLPQEERMSAPAPEAAPPRPPEGPIRNRDDAYRRLEEVAQYLLKAEPHSPTPYLVMRAVSWGRMSLADLMQEIVRQEGDINRYFSLLGIKRAEK